MNFEVNMNYTQKELSIISKALRKTLRKKKIQRLNIFATIIIIFALYTIISTKEFSMITIINIIAVIILITFVLFQDKINGFLGYKKSVKRLHSIKTIFNDNDYTSISEGTAKTQWEYSVVQCVVECGDYIIFLVDNNHGQIFDKRRFEKGDVEQFKIFIEEKTNKKIIKI